MKSNSPLLEIFFLVVVWVSVQACALLTAPVATEVLGGAQLAIKGAELDKEIRKADVQVAIEIPFEKAWDMAIIALVNLDIEITRSERNPQENGGIIEGLVKKEKIRVIAVKYTEKITELGIWAHHDKALAGLIAEKIKEEARKEGASCYLSSLEK